MSGCYKVNHLLLGMSGCYKVESIYEVYQVATRLSSSTIRYVRLLQGWVHLQLGMSGCYKVESIYYKVCQVATQLNSSPSAIRYVRLLQGWVHLLSYKVCQVAKVKLKSIYYKVCQVATRLGSSPIYYKVCQVATRLSPSLSTIRYVKLLPGWAQVHLL